MAKRKRRPKRPNTIHRHHIICRSRGGDKLGDENIARIDGRLHMKYHSLFGNLLPSEILAWLESYFWNNKRKQLEKELKK